MNPREALAALDQAHAFWREFDPESPATADAARWLAEVHTAVGRQAAPSR
jgi:hypothetical protein